MPLYDVTRPVYPGMPLYPGDPPTEVETLASVARGDAYTLSRVCLSAHAGTHVDAPLHYLPGGASVDQLPLDVLTGPCLVRPVFVSRVDAAALAGLALPPGTHRLLLQTAAIPGDAHLTGDGAAWLVAWGVRLVGLDRLSVDGPGGDFPAHRTLLGAGVIILEGLELAPVPPGAYRLVCLPLKLLGCEGAPARAVLW